MAKTGEHKVDEIKILLLKAMSMKNPISLHKCEDPEMNMIWLLFQERRTIAINILNHRVENTEEAINIFMDKGNMIADILGLKAVRL